MKNKKLTGREFILLIILIIILLAVCYYMFYYSPVQSEILSVKNQASEMDAEISTAAAKLGSMSKMQEELDEVYARPENEITEIAPYDNAKVVMSELNGILSQSQNYRLTFADPVIEDNGTVRRTVNMSFSCASYTAATKIVDNLCNSRWRCLMKNLTVDGGEDLTANEVSCSATIVFFESTNLQ